MYRAISSDKSIRHLGTSSWKHFAAITATTVIDFATMRVVSRGAVENPDRADHRRQTMIGHVRGTLLFQFKQIESLCMKGKKSERKCMRKRKTLPLTSMWMVCESERPCLFFAVHVYAPRSVLLSTRYSTSVPFADTSWRRLVGNIWPSVRKK